MINLLAAAGDTTRWHISTLAEALYAAAVFGALGIVFLFLGFKIFDWLLPRLDFEKELAEKNMAVAVVVAALLLSLGYIMAHSIAA